MVKIIQIHMGGVFISASEDFLKGCYLRFFRSRSACKKEYQLLPTEIVFFLDEVFNTYVEFSEDLHIALHKNEVFH